MREYLVDTNRAYAQVIEEADNVSGLTRLYLHGDDLISQSRISGNDVTTAQSDTYLYDGLGSVRTLSSSTGAITDTYIYEAFGGLATHMGTTENRYLFTGEQFDPNVGFYYLRARYYNPSIGRFQTMDTYAGRMHEPQTLHKYLYVHANPVNNIDPSGNFSVGTLSVQTIAVMIRTSAGRQVLGAVFKTGLKNSAKSNGLLVLASLSGSAAILNAVRNDNATTRRRERPIVLYHGTTSNRASKIVQSGFRSPPVYFAQEMATATLFSIEATRQTGARSSTVIEFTIPRRIADAAGVGDADRDLLGSDTGDPWVDVAGGSGYERVIRTQGQLQIFNGALLSNAIVARRLRVGQ